MLYPRGYETRNAINTSLLSLSACLRVSEFVSQYDALCLAGQFNTRHPQFLAGNVCTIRPKYAYSVYLLIASWYR